jgi:hypothetical protein
MSELDVLAMIRAAVSRQRQVAVDIREIERRLAWGGFDGLDTRALLLTQQRLETLSSEHPQYAATWARLMARVRTRLRHHGAGG